MRVRAVRLGICAVVLLVVLLPGGPARAHQSSVSYSHVQIRGDAISYELQVSSRDLFEALELPEDRDATDEEILAGRDELERYVSGRVRFLDGGSGAACEMSLRDLRLVRQTDRFAALRWSVRCPGATRVRLVYDLFFDLDPRHTSRLTLTRGDSTITQPDLGKPTDQDPQANRREWELGGAAHDVPKGHLDWIFEGMMHIYTGWDHVAFLVGLLLVAALRKRTGIDAGWETRGLRSGVLYVLRVVTAFTIAHSITLIAAALGLFELPAPFVESAIAASIVWVAVENVLFGDPRGRWVLAFAFGLIHGFGFAGSLAPMLPPSGVVLPLLELNVGVELGQLSIVIVLYPILHVAAAWSPARYRRIGVIGGSAIVAILGAIWLVERIVDVEIISQWL